MAAVYCDGQSVLVSPAANAIDERQAARRCGSRRLG